MSEFAAGQCMFPFHASAVIGYVPTQQRDQTRKNVTIRSRTHLESWPVNILSIHRYPTGQTHSLELKLEEKFATVKIAKFSTH